MDSSRRRLLAVTSSLAFPLLAGCTGLVGGGSNDDGSSDGGDDSGGGGGDGDSNEQTETTTETPTETATATPEPPDEFLLRTRQVMDEIRWFGTEYPRAKRNFVLRVKPVRETIESLRERNTLAEGDVVELREKTTALATFVSEELAPHFELDGRLRNGENGLVRNFAAAVEQDDSQASQDALGRLAVFYERVTSESYIEHNLSAHPIEEPLHGMLSAGGEGQTIFGVSYPPGDNFTTQTFSDEYSGRGPDEVRPHSHTFPTGQTVYDHAHEYDAGHDIFDHANERPDGLAYTFSQGSVDILKDTKAWRERLADYQPKYTDVFDGVAVRDGRVDYAYVMANTLVTDRTSEAQFAGRPIFVQRFEDESGAAAAMNTLLETTLSEDGTTSLAGREWTKVFYDYDGPNLYGNLYQVGEFLLAASVSPTPHRERRAEDQWPTPLKQSWLGMEVSEETTETADG
ncbi:hypothetical protein [Salinigranum salinum]|uniref:hypothetical protein n=1 Tax=Salinigranum salinum TaxID=1364937 RepID=UPI0012604273|nr:hypothetical protein [Salinigranum salinum]